MCWCFCWQCHSYCFRHPGTASQIIHSSPLVSSIQFHPYLREKWPGLGQTVILYSWSNKFQGSPRCWTALRQFWFFWTFTVIPEQKPESYVPNYPRGHGPPVPPITSLQSAGYVRPICPFKTSAVSLPACEILSLLKSVLNLPLTSIKRAFTSWLRENKKR